MRQTATHSAAPATRQFLTFTLHNGADDATQARDYGIDLLSVQEIRGYTAATPIPNAPAHVKGAINLRGAVIPVLDLRIRFAVPNPQYTPFTVIIVVSISGKTVGLVADSVSDVLDLAPDRVLPPPDFGPRRDGDCIEGIAEVEGNLVLMLDLNRMLASDGIVDLREDGPMGAAEDSKAREAA
jgi:purine-binding chemotaxis protein CheW